MKIKSHKLLEHLKEQPPGDLVCVKNGIYHRWHSHVDGKVLCISKRNTQELTTLAQKKYLLSEYEDTLDEIAALELYLAHFNPDESRTSKLLNEGSPYLPLLSNNQQPNSDELNEWIREAYEQNPQYLEHKIHRSLSGNMVRSKSESLIDNALYYNKIPFRYECKLQLGETTFYPDFTIKHPKNMQIYYWEHFGMMDNAAYRNNHYSKLVIYNNYGIFQSVNLIVTYETKDNPLDAIIIDNLIQQHFID